MSNSNDSDSDSEDENNNNLALKQHLMQLDRGRLPKSFRSGKTSYQLILFHVHFLSLFRGSNKLQLEQVKTLLDSCLGVPSLTLQSEWQIHVKQLKKLNNWNSFFSHLNLPIPEEQFLLSWLRQSVENSLRKGYHRNKFVRKKIKLSREQLMDQLDNQH